MRLGFNIWRLLTTGLVLLGVGIALIVITAGEMLDYSKKGTDYSTLEWFDFHEGMMVEGDLPMNYGAYEEIIDQDNNNSVGQFFLIDSGTARLMGLYTPVKSLISSLEEQYDQWQSDYDITPVHFKGKVTEMDDEDRRFIRQYLINEGFTAEEADDYVIDLYIKCVDTDSHPVLLIIGIVASVGGIVFLLMFVRRKIMGR